MCRALAYMICVARLAWACWRVGLLGARETCHMDWEGEKGMPNMRAAPSDVCSPDV